MTYKVISKVQLLLFLNQLFFQLLWHSIFLLTNSYVPLLNLVLLQWRALFQVIVQLKSKDCTAILQTGRPTGWSLLLHIITPTGIMYIIKCIVFYYCNGISSHLHKTMVWEVLTNMIFPTPNGKMKGFNNWIPKQPPS